MTKELTLNTLCPHCQQGVSVTTELNPCMIAPDVRGKIRPAGYVYVYKISSEQIRQFIIQKSRKLVADVKVEVAARYCEKKRKKDTDVHRSYASLRIAFSDKAIDRKEDLGWFGKIAESGSHVRIVETLFQNLIRKYQYDKKKVERWMKSYQNLEELEDAFGMTEEYIADIREFTTPRRITTENNETWVMFAGAPENVIHDMLTDLTTDEVAGRVSIQDIYQVSKDVVEFIVHLYPEEIQLKENPHVRQILRGEEKPKK